MSSFEHASAEPTTPDTTSGAPPILVVMGVSGCGKSTLAAYLAGQLGWDLAEGDDLHPAANVRKMAAGHPLDDNDRGPWLSLIADWIDRHAAEGRPGVVTCSALKRRYRDVLRRPQVVFVHAAGPRELIQSRLHGRLDHIMPESLLDSQYADLEELEDDEAGLVVGLEKAPQDQAVEVEARLGLVPAARPQAQARGNGSTQAGAASPVIPQANSDRKE